MKSISIFLNKEGNTAAPNEEGIVKVYAYNDTSNSWSITNEIGYHFPNSPWTRPE